MIQYTPLDAVPRQISTDTRIARSSSARARGYALTAIYGKANLAKSLWQMLDTLIPYSLLWVLMVQTIHLKYPYWTTLVLALPAGGMLVRIFILFHDCCHGSFFPRAAQTQSSAM